MSVLRVAKLQGISQTNFEITIPSTHKLIVLGSLRADSIQNTSGVTIWNPDSSGNISISGNITSTAGTISASVMTATGRVNLPAWTSSTRPTTSLVNGIIGYNSTIGQLEVYSSGSWVAVAAGGSTVGTQTNPATSGMVIKNAGLPSGLYWIQPSGQSAYQMYVDNNRNGGGWVLCSTVRTSTCQDHMTNNWVRISGNTGPRTGDTSTTKMNDSWINALRSSSTYTGSTAYWLEALNFNKNMFVDRNATVDLSNSASNQNERTRVTLSYEGGLDDRGPNTGTRGFGDHHTSGGTYFAWGRHPEQGGNCGFREDNLGASNGYLWVK